ncbi:hypothetical protein RND81_01G051600 [Saponaria officinalis]|uniref:Zinc finger GRF-type domain-containing protein n=1 Tax=Saponaria officinalis TaxID=3572 RepID=A0AAW1M705_SAPOF
MDSFCSQSSSYPKNVHVENKNCPRCNVRANIRTSGPNAANPFKLYYKCDECGWFQWCKIKTEAVLYNAREQCDQVHNYQELKMEMKEQKEIMRDMKRKLEDMSKLINFSVKAGALMFMFVIYVVMNKNK